MSVTATRFLRDPGPVLWLTTGAAWLATLVLMLVPAAMGAMPSMAAADLAGGVASPATVVAVFAGGWIVMVAAMMLPTTVPMARMVVVVTSGVPARRRVLGAFFGAYVAVWTAAGLVGLWPRRSWPAPPPVSPASSCSLPCSRSPGSCSSAR